VIWRNLILLVFVAPFERGQAYSNYDNYKIYIRPCFNHLPVQSICRFCSAWLLVGARQI